MKRFSLLFILVFLSFTLYAQMKGPSLWEIQEENFWCLGAHGDNMVAEFVPGSPGYYKVALPMVGEYVVSTNRLGLTEKISISVTCQSGPQEVIMRWAKEGDIIFVVFQGRTRRFVLNQKKWVVQK